MPSLQMLSQVQIFMDSTFYGCFAMLFTVSCVVLNKRFRVLETQSQRNTEKEDPTVSEKRELKFWKTLGSLLIVLTTLHWAFAWATMMSRADNTPFRSRMSFMRFILEMLSIFVGDTLMLSRLWKIGGKNIVAILFPLLCLTGFVACAIRLTVLEVRHLLLFLKSPSDIQWWFVGTMALTTSMNLYSTVFIAWKALSANTVVHRSVYTYFMRIISIVVESAAIYTIWMIILLGIVTRNATLWSMLMPISPSLYGCTMMLISVRLGLGWALGLGGQAAKKPKSLVMQFARSEESDSDDIEYEYRD